MTEEVYKAQFERLIFATELIILADTESMLEYISQIERRLEKFNPAMVDELQPAKRYVAAVYRFHQEVSVVMEDLAHE